MAFVTKTAAAYIRVSTKEQLEFSPASQLEKIREYAKNNDLILPDEYIFFDEGISGLETKKRPGFLKMIAKASSKPKPFDVVLLWSFSRFARNREDSIVYKSLLRRKFCIFTSLAKNKQPFLSVLIKPRSGCLYIMHQ